MEQGVNQHSPVELVPPPSEGIKSRDQAGALVGVNGRYVSEAGTFEEYCQSKFKMDRIHAHRLMVAAPIAKELLPTGNITERDQAGAAVSTLPRNCDAPQGNVEPRI
jgi:hypothetical protein